MAASINFVSVTRKRLTRSQKQDLNNLQKAAYVVGGAFLIFLLALGMRFFFIYQLKQISDRQEEVRAAITSQEDLEEEYTIFSHKLKQLTHLFGKRKDKQEALIFFNQVFGPDVEVSGIDYTGSKEDVLSFTLRAPDIFLLDQVFKTLNSQEVSSKYKSVQKDGLRRREDGTYSMQLTLTFSDTAAEQANSIEQLEEN